jgi:hypothetical protein
MAYLDNKTIIVDATLTKKGRELLAQNGNLNINSFALADDEIDYSLYDPNHPEGSNFNDFAIRKTPILEAFFDETQVMKYKLVTLNQGVTTIPVISLNVTNINVPSTFTGDSIISPSTTPTYNTILGYTAILANKNVGTIVPTINVSANTVSNTVTSFTGVSVETSQVVIGLQFKFLANPGVGETTTTTLTIIGNESGGSVTMPVTVTV